MTKKKASPEGETPGNENPEAQTGGNGEEAVPEELVNLEDLESAEELSPEEDPIALLEGEISALKDQLLRAVAETENVRSRSRRERDEGIKYASVPLLTDLLSVADNLNRAIQSIPPESIEENEQLKNLLTGVQMTERELLSVFDKHKVEKIDPLGELLNPHFHQAMFEVPDPSQPSGTIVQVVQPGFVYQGRLLRAAMVGVAKGGPKPSAANDTTTEAPANEP